MLINFIPIAVGIVINENNQVLVSYRNRAPQCDLWEFPGGKVKSLESPYQALCRELMEELGIQVQLAIPLLPVDHQYDDYRVVIHPWIINQFSGTAQGCEQQSIQWIDLQSLSSLSMPLANQAILAQLTQETCTFSD